MFDFTSFKNHNRDWNRNLTLRSCEIKEDVILILCSLFQVIVSQTERICVLQPLMVACARQLIEQIRSYTRPYLLNAFWFHTSQTLCNLPAVNNITLLQPFQSIVAGYQHSYHAVWDCRYPQVSKNIRADHYWYPSHRKLELKCCYWQLPSCGDANVNNRDL